MSLPVVRSARDSWRLCAPRPGLFRQVRCACMARIPDPSGKPCGLSAACDVGDLQASAVKRLQSVPRGQQRLCGGPAAPHRLEEGHLPALVSLATREDLSSGQPQSAEAQPEVCLEDKSVSHFADLLLVYSTACKRGLVFKLGSPSAYSPE